MQDCSISIANALELLQSYTKPLEIKLMVLFEIWRLWLFGWRKSGILDKKAIHSPCLTFLLTTG